MQNMYTSIDTTQEFRSLDYIFCYQMSALFYVGDNLTTQIGNYLFFLKKFNVLWVILKDLGSVLGVNTRKSKFFAFLFCKALFLNCLTIAIIKNRVVKSSQLHAFIRILNFN